MSKIMSPVMAYKIAIVNGANLNQQFVNEVKQFERASRRLSRAIRKARQMAMTSQNIMLFGQRENGEHFPISYKTPRAATKSMLPHSNSMVVGAPLVTSDA